MRRLIGALVVAFAWLIAAPAQAAHVGMDAAITGQGGVSTSHSAAVTDHRGVITSGGATTPEEGARSSEDRAREWFQQSGQAAVRAQAQDVLPQLTSQDTSRIEIGAIQRASGFTSAGNVGESDVWIAPLSLDGEVVGVLVAHVNQADVTPSLKSDTGLANEVAHRSQNALVYDSATKGWYLVSSRGEVSALDSVAQEFLAGKVSLGTFAKIREPLLGSSVPQTPAIARGVAPVNATSPILVTAIVMAILLAVVGVLVWIRHETEAHPRNPNKADEPNYQDDRMIRCQTGELVRVIDKPVKDGVSE